MKLEVENLIGEFVYQGEDRPDLTNVINGEIGMFHYATNKSIVLAVLPFCVAAVRLCITSRFAIAYMMPLRCSPAIKHFQAI